MARLLALPFFIRDWGRVEEVGFTCKEIEVYLNERGRDMGSGFRRTSSSKYRILFPLNRDVIRESVHMGVLLCGGEETRSIDNKGRRLSLLFSIIDKKWEIPIFFW